jgi:hypothetical protein
MKRNFTILTSLLALILFVTPVLAGDTPACTHAKAGCCAGKGMTMQVANIDKGVTVTLTGENAEAVKSIQDHAAKCAKHECCVSKEGKEGCCDKATCPMKDAKIQVTNNDKGAVITVTSDKSETETAIQKCMADCHGAKHEAHGQKTEAQSKAKTDACGKCPMKSDCAKQPAPEKEIK